MPGEVTAVPCAPGGRVLALGGGGGGGMSASVGLSALLRPGATPTRPASPTSLALTPLVYRDDEGLPWRVCVLYIELAAVLRGICASAVADGIMPPWSSRSNGSDRNLLRLSENDSAL